MNSTHAKSPCCGAPVRRFGRRRRQCAQCHGTWRIRPKKRGRRSQRPPASILHRVFVQGFTLAQLSARRGAPALPTYRHRFRQALDRFVARPSTQRIPRGPLVLLVDGLWFQFDETPWVLYLTALKPCRGHSAVFLDPLLIVGKECAAGWQQAVAALPAPATSRIRALVADNLPGMRRLAQQHDWTLQLCHFHLLLKLQVRHRGVRYALRGGAVRQEIHELIRTALAEPDNRRLQQAVERLRQLSQSNCGTRRIQMIVREFLRALPYYRSYLTHPQLGLPHTTNTVESMGRLLRDLFRRSRAGSNPASVLRWATAFMRLRPHITCNSHR